MSWFAANAGFLSAGSTYTLDISGETRYGPFPNWCTDVLTRFLDHHPFYDYPANQGKNEEPTSGLEPLTCSSYE
jgi:hypothetical protein